MFLPQILNHVEIVCLPNSIGLKAHINKVKERDFQSMKRLETLETFVSSGNEYHEV